MVLHLCDLFRLGFLAEKIEEISCDADEIKGWTFCNQPFEPWERPVMLPIPGTSSIEHLEENVRAASLRLTDEEYRELTSVSESPPSFRS